VTGSQPADGPAELAAVRDAQSLLAGLDERPLPEHVAALDEVHRRLQDALATLDGA
jgi:hypothetical protein